MVHTFIQDFTFKIDSVQITELLLHHIDELYSGRLWGNIIDRFRLRGVFYYLVITHYFPTKIHQRGEEELGSSCTGLRE